MIAKRLVQNHLGYLHRHRHWRRSFRYWRWLFLGGRYSLWVSLFSETEKGRTGYEHFWIKVQCFFVFTFCRRHGRLCIFKLLKIGVSLSIETRCLQWYGVYRQRCLLGKSYPIITVCKRHVPIFLWCTNWTIWKRLNWRNTIWYFFILKLIW